MIACRNVEEISKNSAKRVTIEGTADLSGLSGIRSLEKTDRTTTFLYSGDMKEMLSMADGYVWNCFAKSDIQAREIEKKWESSVRFSIIRSFSFLMNRQADSIL